MKKHELSGVPIFQNQAKCLEILGKQADYSGRICVRTHDVSVQIPRPPSKQKRREITGKLTFYLWTFAWTELWSRPWTRISSSKTRRFVIEKKKIKIHVTFRIHWTWVPKERLHCIGIVLFTKGKEKRIAVLRFTRKQANTYLTGHDSTKYSLPNICVHTLLTCYFQ